MSRSIALASRIIFAVFAAMSFAERQFDLPLKRLSWSQFVAMEPSLMDEVESAKPVELAILEVLS